MKRERRSGASGWRRARRIHTERKIQKAEDEEEESFGKAGRRTCDNNNNSVMSQCKEEDAKEEKRRSIRQRNGRVWPSSSAAAHIKGIKHRARLVINQPTVPAWPRARRGRPDRHQELVHAAMTLVPLRQSQRSHSSLLTRFGCRDTHRKEKCLFISGRHILAIS
ncbi:uncharacterized protein LOC144208555 [Stigmatopora nigra]